MNKIPTFADTDTMPYWEAAAAGELKLQRCNQCDAMQSIPRTLCAVCHQTDLGWIKASGHGVVASYSWVERGPTAAFREPYMLALIDLEEGVRLMMNIVGRDRKSAAIGAAVNIVFETQEADGTKLPQARLTPRKATTP